MGRFDLIQRRALRILYVWWVENFSKYMPRKEFEKRLKVGYDANIDEIIRTLKEKGLIEITPEDENWSALRITNEGVDLLRASDVI